MTHTWRQKPPHEYPVYPLPDNVTRAGTDGTEIALEFSWGERLPVPARFSLGSRGLTLDRTHVARLRENLESLTEQLPLIVYYEQNRVATSSARPGLVSVSSEVNRNSSLYTTASSPSEFKSWFFEREGDEARDARERRDLQHEYADLKAIRGLLTQLDGFSARPLPKAAREQRSSVAARERRDRDRLRLALRGRAVVFSCWPQISHAA